ncbi:MAG: sugar phosphate isomerase/epimerase [Kiritimatiellae bacterium]|nr:sugar phosphate isomerase/epimerase [Kiritimatiellia bacterium]
MIKFGKCCSLADAPQAAADGFDYFETTVAEALMPDKGEEAWQENKLRLRDIELPLYACNGFLPGTMRLTGPNARPEQALDYAEGACRRADEIGCKFIVFGSGGARNVPGDFTKPGERPDVERGRDQFAEFCAGLAERISGCRVTVVIEPLCPNESNIINYVWQAMQIVKDVDSPRMEVLADLYHMIQGRETAESIVAAGPHLRHCHIAMRGTRAYPGDGPAFEFAPYFEALAKIGYAGGISCECGWPLREGQTISDAHRLALATLRELAGQE